MDRDTVIALARKSNIGTYINLDSHLVGNHLERFAALVAAHEREACAKLAGDFAVDLDDVWVCEKLADAIRSRE